MNWFTNFKERMMKKFAVIIAAAWLVAACSLKEAVNVPSPSIVSSKVFHAQIESSRTFVNDHNVCWSRNDSIAIFDFNTYKAVYYYAGEDGAVKGDFIASPHNNPGDADALPLVYALYPYNEWSSVDEDGYIDAYFPSQQEYEPGSFGPESNVMVAASTDESLSFKNASGYLKLRLYGEHSTPLYYVEVASNDGEPLSGWGYVHTTLNDDPVVEMEDGFTNDYALVYDSYGQMVLGDSADAPLDIWFALPPGTIQSGITVTVMDYVDKKTSFSTSNPLTIKRGVCTSTAPVRVDFGPSQEMLDFYPNYLGEWVLKSPKLNWTISPLVEGESYIISGIEGFDWPVVAYLNHDLQLEIPTQRVKDSYTVNNEDCTVFLYGLDNTEGYYWTGNYTIAYGALDSDGNIQLSGGSISSSLGTLDLGTMILLAESESSVYTVSNNSCSLPNVLLNPNNVEEENSPIVTASYDDFIGAWEFGGNVFEIVAGQTEDSYTVVLNEGLYATAYFEEGALTLYDQVCGAWNHSTYGLCYDFIGGWFPYGGSTYMYYYYNNGKDFDSITKLFTAQLHESGNITLEPGSCEYGTYSSVWCRWIIMNEENNNYGLGSTYGLDFDLDIIVKPHVESSAAPAAKRAAVKKSSVKSFDAPAASFARPVLRKANCHQQRHISRSV